MTLRELIQSSGQHWVPLCSTLVAVPIVSILLGMTHRRGDGGNAPWKFGYSILVYLACIPGIFASVLTAYSLFFSNENLLDANLLIYFLPITTMIVTLVAIRKRVPFEQVPGFDRLSGLMVLLGCSFAIALALHKTRLFIGFFGSAGMLFALAAGVFVIMRWAASRLFRSPSEPAQPMPGFPPNQQRD
jgi:hypothetical protein